MPDGMVFVSADDWPELKKHRTAKEYCESYTGAYDFAIDKYATSAVDNVPNCTIEDFPCTTAHFTGYLASVATSTPIVNINWFSFKQGCDRRTEILGVLWATQGVLINDYQSGRKVHLVTGHEWMVGSFETSDSVGPQFCNLSTTFWTTGAISSTNSTERCQSRYGAINMIGNYHERTDEIVVSNKIYNFQRIDNLGIEIGTINPLVAGHITSWSFNLNYPTQVSAVQTESKFFADQTSSVTNNTYFFRGGANVSGAAGGRFNFFINNWTSAGLSGRCALRAP